MTDSRSHTRADYYWLYVMNAVVAALMSRGYFAALEPSFSDRIYIAFIWLAHFGSAFLIIGLATWILTRVFRSPGRRMALAIGLLTLVQMLLFVDMRIYQVNRYHFNGYVLSVITSGLGEAIQPDMVSVLKLLAMMALLVGVQAVLVRFLKVAYFFMPSLSRPLFWSTMGAILLLAAADKAYYAYADLYVNLGKIRYTKLLPLYRPATMKHFAQKHLKIDREKQKGKRVPVSSSMLAYPTVSELPAPVMAGGVRSPNFLLIVIDSWRSDMFSRETTPNLHAFSRRCSVYQTHYSGGHSSHFGIFSLIYGLYGTYWKSFLDESRGSLLIDYLKANGYEFRIISSTRLSFPPLRRMAFAEIQDSITDDLPGANSDMRDLGHEEEFLSWLDARQETERPFFAYLFMDAPHFPYHYPEGYGPFNPAAKSIEYMSVDARGNPEPFRNRYRNAIHYDDKLLGSLLAGIEKRGLLKSTVLFVTGDHGEEFMESGNWAHTNAFSMQQVKVPLLAHFPGLEGREVKVKTTHADVATTMFKMAGCGAEDGKFWQGRSLLDLPEREYVIAGGFHNCALMRDQDIIVIPTASFYLAEIEVRDMNYQLIGAGVKAIRGDSRFLLKNALRDLSGFRR